MSYTPSPNYFYQRNSHYWFNYAYSTPLRGLLKSQGLRFSLRTTDQSTAKLRALTIASRLKRHLQNMTNETSQQLTHKQLRQLAQQWLSDSIEAAEHYHAEFDAMTPDEWTAKMDTYASLEADAAEALSLGAKGKHKRIVDSLLSERASDQEKTMLNKEISKAYVELLAAHQRILSGLDGQEEKAYAPTQSIPEEQKPAQTSPMLSDLIDKFINEKVEAGDWADRTLLQEKAYLQLLLDVLGDQPVRDITRDDIQRYRATILRLPPNRSKDKRYKDLTVAEILELDDVEPMSAQTAQHALRRTKTFLTWCVNIGVIDKAPSDGINIKVQKGKGSSSRKEFTESDLQSLFSTPDYTNGTHTHPYRFWVPLIGVYTGARLGEICQLHLSDFRLSDGVWLIDIQSDTEGNDTRTVKTAAGERSIPVHSVLIEIGLIEYVETLRKKGETRLFPELRKGSAGWSDIASKWFKRYRTDAGVEDDGKVFHSFRHTVISALLQHNDIRQEHVQELVGHEVGSVTYGTYFHGLKPLQLQAIIERLHWNSIKIEHLKTGWKKQLEN